MLAVDIHVLNVWKDEGSWFCAVVVGFVLWLYCVAVLVASKQNGKVRSPRFSWVSIQVQWWI